ncbi:hypothetical protein [Stratiformator vulcanicus]|uniref:Uncharacterized protein n=1 Tax=Stratiformator vulcanicus TaxID=2527980 RepID=A0A517R561_9PLAN|nr:hypothetical protein [Stratiformator vulcanicus]QDT39037.1 hypothetical protein Pan189_34380 [Stratiformator vulcanicus]
MPDDISRVVAALYYFRFCGASPQVIDNFATNRFSGEWKPAFTYAALTRLQSDGFAEKRGSFWYLTKDQLKLAKGGFQKPDFEHADVALAMTIAGTEGKKSLTSILNGIDFIERYILSFDELYRGLNRLHAAKLIGYRSRSFFATDRCMSLLKEAKNHSHSMHGHLESLERLIQCPCCGPKLRRVTWRIAISEEDYLEAVDAYCGDR